MNNLDIITVKEAISGPVPSFSTPFTRDGEIDWPGVDRTIDFLIASGAKSLLLTNGDSLLTVLSDRESELLLKRIVCGVKGKALVLAGGKAWCTKQTLEYMRFARETGADIGLPMIPDWAQSAGADEMFSLLEASGRILPTMALTNLCSNRGIPASVFQRLIIEHTPGFVGVKDDMTGSYGRRLAALLGGQYAFLSGGRAENHLDVAPYGADGYLSIFMRVKPEKAWQYWNLWQSGDLDGCARWIMRYEVPFMDFVSQSGLHFDLVIHAIMEIEGICGRWRRSPYRSATDEDMEKIRSFWNRLVRMSVEAIEKHA